MDFQLIQPLTYGRGWQIIYRLERRVAKLYFHVAHGAYVCESAACVNLSLIFQLPLKYLPVTIMSSSIHTF